MQPPWGGSASSFDVEEFSPEALPQVAQGFSLSLFAREPLIRNPACLAFDSRGRLFVGQGPQFRNPEADSPRDQVLLVEDRDGDGIADSTQTFAFGFNSVQGLAWKGNDLWVANAPDLTVVRDTDGDLRADEYVLVYSGLGTLEHALHGLNWAPDGRLYLSKGDTPVLPEAPAAFRELAHVPSDFPTSQPVRTFNPPDSPENPYRGTFIVPTDPHTEGGVLRCDAEGGNLEIFARGMRNPYDFCFDSEFNWLGTDNDQDEGDRIISPFFGAHFGHRHPWSYHWTGEDHPPTVPLSGPRFQGSGTGIVFCSGSSFPEGYRNAFLIGDWLAMSVYLFRPRWEGALMQSATPDLEEIIFRGETGALFRPTDLAVGPDGAVYITGWGKSYGSEWDDQGQLTNEGRVYRLWHSAHRPPSPEVWDTPHRKQPLSSWTLEDLIEDLNADLPAWTVNAQDELVRRGPEGRRDLEERLRSGLLSGAERTWMAWALGRIDLEDSSLDRFFSALLEDNEQPLGVRLQALRILGFRMQQSGSASLPTAAIECLKSENPRLRFEAVQAIWQAGQKDRAQDLLDLLADEKDRLTYYSAWGAVRDFLSVEERKALLGDPRPRVRFGILLGLLEGGNLTGDEAVKLLDTEKDPEVQKWALRWMAEVGAGLSDPADVIRRLLDLNKRGYNLEPRMNLLKVLGRMELTGENWETLYQKFFVGHQNGEIYVPEKSQEIALALRVLSQDPRALPVLWEAIDHPWDPVRKAAIESFREQGKPGREFLLAKLQEPIDEKQAGIVEALSRFPAQSDFGPFDARQVAVLAKVFDSNASVPIRMKAMGLLIAASKATWSEDAAKRIATEVAIKSGQDPDPRIVQRASLLANRVGVEIQVPVREPTTPEAVLARLVEADPARGRALFFEEEGRASCYRCHRVEERGNPFAPDLSDVGGRTDIPKLIESILAPDAAITEGFQSQMIETVEGDTYVGVAVRETENALVLVQSDGVETPLEKAAILERRGLSTSVMPSNMGELLTPQEVADIAVWLATLRPKP